MHGKQTSPAAPYSKGWHPWLQPIYSELQRYKSANSHGSMPGVSVLVPTFKGEEVALYESITALEGSDYPKYALEVLVLMDSHDNSTKVVTAELAGRYHNVLPLAADLKMGMADAPSMLNIGLWASTGRIVGLIGAKDMLPPTALLEAAYLISSKRFGAMSVVSEDSAAHEGLIEEERRHSLAERLGIRSGSRSNGTATQHDPFQIGFFDKDTIMNLGGWDESSISDGFSMKSRLAHAGVRSVQSSYHAWKVHLLPAYVPFESKIYTSDFYERHSDDYHDSGFSAVLEKYRRREVLESEKQSEGEKVQGQEPSGRQDSQPRRKERQV